MVVAETKSWAQIHTLLLFSSATDNITVQILPMVFKHLHILTANNVMNRIGTERYEANPNLDHTRNVGVFDLNPPHAISPSPSVKSLNGSINGPSATPDIPRNVLQLGIHQSRVTENCIGWYKEKGNILVTHTLCTKETI